MELAILVATALYLMLAALTLSTRNFISGALFKFIPAVLSVALLWLIISKYSLI